MLKEVLYLVTSEYSSWVAFLLKEKDTDYSKERNIWIHYIDHEYSQGHAQVLTQASLSLPTPKPGPTYCGVLERAGQVATSNSPGREASDGIWTADCNVSFEFKDETSEKDERSEKKGLFQVFPHKGQVETSCMFSHSCVFSIPHCLQPYFPLRKPKASHEKEPWSFFFLCRTNCFVW